MLNLHNDLSTAVYLLHGETSN